MRDCVLLGDLEYLPVEYQLQLFEIANIKPEIPKHKIQYNCSTQPYIIRKPSKQNETMYSQLSDQFMIRSNYAKTFKGLKLESFQKYQLNLVL